MIYITIVAGIFLAEFFGKSYIEKHKKEGKEEPVWGGRIVIRKYHNRGAFLNAGEGRSSVVAVLSFSDGVRCGFLFADRQTERKIYDENGPCPASGRGPEQYV